VRPVLQLLGVFVAMVGLLAALGFAVYALWWIAMFVMSFFPTIGRRHRHSDWARLQKGKSGKGLLYVISGGRSVSNRPADRKTAGLPDPGRRE